jgi:hypothetical protein
MQIALTLLPQSGLDQCDGPDLIFRHRCLDACGVPRRALHLVAQNSSGIFRFPGTALSASAQVDADKSAALFEQRIRSYTARCNRCTSPNETACCAVPEGIVGLGLDGLLGVMGNMMHPLDEAAHGEKPASPFVDLGCWDGPHTIGAWAAEHALRGGLPVRAVIDHCRNVSSNSFLKMACTHGAVWSTVSHRLRHYADSAAKLWQLVADAAGVTTLEGDAGMLAHVAHGLGHGVAIGVASRALSRASGVAPLPHASLSCVPIASMDLTPPLHEEAMRVCSAAPTQQLRLVCAGGVYMHAFMIGDAEARQKAAWYAPCDASPFPAMCFRFRFEYLFLDVRRTPLPVLDTPHHLLAAI